MTDKAIKLDTLKPQKTPKFELEGKQYNLIPLEELSIRIEEVSAEQAEILSGYKAQLKAADKAEGAKTTIQQIEFVKNNYKDISQANKELAEEMNPVYVDFFDDVLLDAETNKKVKAGQIFAETFKSTATLTKIFETVVKLAGAMNSGVDEQLDSQMQAATQKVSQFKDAE